MNIRDEQEIAQALAQRRASHEAYRYDDAATEQDRRLALATGMTPGTISHYRRTNSQIWAQLCNDHPGALAGLGKAEPPVPATMGAQIYAILLMAAGAMLVAYGWTFPGPLSILSLPLGAYFALAGVLDVRSAEKKGN